MPSLVEKGSDEAFMVNIYTRSGDPFKSENKSNDGYDGSPTKQFGGFMMRDVFGMAIEGASWGMESLGARTDRVSMALQRVAFAKFDKPQAIRLWPHLHLHFRRHRVVW